MSVAVRAQGLTKRFSGVTALDDVTIDFSENTITGLLGRNGAGKTTLLQLLTGQVLPTAGRVTVFGKGPYENDSLLMQMCLIREGQKYPESYKVRHVLQAAALLYPRWDGAYADELMRDFDLPPGRPVKKLSRGMLSALGVIVGLASRAPVTLFDEPYLGLDAVARQLFYDRLLADYAENPRTIVLSTHLIDEVSDLIEHVVVIDRGAVLVDANAETLRTQALTVTGPQAAVDQLADDLVVLHREDLGHQSRATVSGGIGEATRARATSLGLAVDAVSLQQLVVRMTTHASAAARGTTARDRTSEGISR